MTFEQREPSPLLQPFYPALDGLRAVAFLLVFLCHYLPAISTSPLAEWGFTGVDLFFVLSGFLITGILYDSVHRKDFFRNFYTRRTLRIFPLFYGFWILMVVLTPILHLQWNLYVIAMAAYVGNFFMIGPGPFLLHANPGIIIYSSLRHPGMYNVVTIRHFWSLCVEEQFYLVWPAVIFWVRSRRTLLRVCLAVMVALPLLRALYLHSHFEPPGQRLLYFNTFARADTLLCGAALALWLRGNPPSPARLHRLSITLAFAAPLLLAACIQIAMRYALVPSFNDIVESIGYTLIAITASAFLVLAIHPASWLSRALQSRPLAAIGRITYGMYFFHLMVSPIFFAIAPALVRHHLGGVVLPLAFILIYGIAWLSFRYLESPFLRLKTKLAPRAGAANDPPPAEYGPHTLQPPIPNPVV